MIVGRTYETGSLEEGGQEAAKRETTWMAAIGRGAVAKAEVAMRCCRRGRLRAQRRGGGAATGGEYEA